MYSICLKEQKGNDVKIEKFDGFLMASSKKGFNIKGEIVRNINVIDKKMASGVVTKKVFTKYNKLISLLTELLISDDDSGESFRIALNHIEKFRLEVKIKYRKFLKQKELEIMSKQLAMLKKEASTRLLEIEDSYINSKSSGKGR